MGKGKLSGRARHQGVRIVFAATTVIALSVAPIGRAAVAARGTPAPPRVTIASSAPVPDGDNAEVDAIANASTATRTDVAKERSDFNYFSASPSTGTQTAAAGNAKASSHLDATVTDFTGNVFSSATANASTSGSASRNTNEEAHYTPDSSGDADFRAAVAVSEPTEVSINVHTSQSNADQDDCTQVTAFFQVDQNQFTGTRGAGGGGGGGCTNSGPLSFDGVINSFAQVEVHMSAKVDTEELGTSNHFSGSFSVTLSVVGECTSAPTSHHGIRIVDGGVHAQGSQCGSLIGHIVFTGSGPTDVTVMAPGGFNPGQPLDLTPNAHQGLGNAAWSPDGKQIAFDNGQQIFTMTAGGSEIQQLTSLGANTEPAWSPDGTQIAFVSNRTGHQEIWVMDEQGGGQTQLTNIGKDSESPAWSPDGHTIAFALTRSGNEDIWSILSTGGAQPTRLTSNPGTDENPTFVSNGTILFDTKRQVDGNFEIYSMTADGLNETNLTNDPGADLDPTGSPDGNFVAFTSDRAGGLQLFAMPIEGGTATQLTTGGGFEPNWGRSACTFYGTAGPDTFTGDAACAEGRVTTISPAGSRTTRSTEGRATTPSKRATAPTSSSAGTGPTRSRGARERT